MSGDNCDLLVVGLGPVGDVLSGLAQLHGLSIIAIDKQEQPYPLPRAAVFDHEVMRIFQMLGVEDEIAALCRVPERYEFVNGKGDLLLGFDIAPFVPESGWAESYALHQPAVEAVLVNRVAQLGADVRRGVRLVSFDQYEDGVRARVEGADGPYDIGARFVVGCDGASSTVRERMDTPLFDYSFDEPWLVLDTICNVPGGLPLTLRQVCDPKRPFTYMPMSGRRFRWEFMIRPDEDPADLLDDRSIAELIAPWCTRDQVEIERKAIYRFHALVANEWRKGRVLIAGDAAHQMPPFAGQGMCSGIRDANNLAWKLATVLRGEADMSLLDTYQAEREPHVRSIIETAIAMGRTVCILDEDAAAARDAAMIAQRESGAQAISIRHPDLYGGMLTTTPQAGALFPQALANGQRFDTLLDRRPAIIGRNLPARPDIIAAFDLDQPRLAPFAEEIDAWLAGQDAVLIRPDRHVFGTGAAQELISAWQMQSLTAAAATTN